MEMKKVLTTVNLAEDEYEDVQRLARVNGFSVDEYMHQVVIEQLNDSKDYEAGIKVLAQNNKQISRENVLSEVLE